MQADNAKGTNSYPYLLHFACSPSSGYLLDIKNCGSTSKSAEFLADKFTRVYESLTDDIRPKIRGYVTNNCTTNRSAWRILGG